MDDFWRIEKKISELCHPHESKMASDPSIRFLLVGE